MTRNETVVLRLNIKNKASKGDSEFNSDTNLIPLSFILIDF